MRNPGFQAFSGEHHSRYLLETLNPRMEQPALRIWIALGRFWKMPLTGGKKSDVSWG